MRAVAAVIFALMLVGLGSGPRSAEATPPPPARFAGIVSAFNFAVPVGSTVDAYVGSTLCGSSSVFLMGGQTVYVVDVESSEAVPGCGVVGSTVIFKVAGFATSPTGTWANTVLNSLDLLVIGSPPARFVGNVYINGLLALPGTPLEARVAGATCATSTVFSQFNGVTYLVDVAADFFTSPGCGTPGDVVQFYVAGIEATPTGIWLNFQLNMLDLYVETLSPGTCDVAPGKCIAELQHFRKGRVK